ncbi:DUF3413 domain-containing protein [Vibrio splendidus]|uniref:Choline-sulfatase n=1 Tax=Vibrio splendidus TaxID=29497 RepID=A0A2N7FB94_VIBSP|nr:DUF3413 domain-containing protein [Vibrio splendidus]PMJ65718.1 choline-sulfatase [Vibrio splendidus]
MNKLSFRSIGWFILINAMLAILISIRCFEFFPIEAFTPLSIIYAVSSVVGQIFLLTCLFGILLLPSKWLSQNKATWYNAILASLLLVLLFIDTIVFAQYRFHINAVVVGLILAGDIVDFPLVTWAMATIGFLSVLLIELKLMKWIVNRGSVLPKKLGRKITAIAVVTFLVANFIHTWAAANAFQPVSMVNRYIPLYYPLTANSLMKKLGWIDLDAVEQGKSLTKSQKGDLNYPLQPITTEQPQELKDIVLIVVDSWRYDTFSEEVTPITWSLSQQGAVFNNHMSTGNATRAGIFGTFYGMPSTYWHAFLANQRSPLLMDRLQELNYQLGIFTAAQLIKPEFNRTVFRNVPNLRIRSEGATPSAKDRDLTNDWKAWFEKTDSSKPQFSFLFFDAPHGYDFPSGYDAGFSPMLKELNYLTLNNDTNPEPMFNRYKNSVHYVDSLIGEVVKTLEKSGRIDDTLLIITSDHGQELNDNKLNFWGHNSNFTDVQVKVPFIVIDPKFNQLSSDKLNESFTSHEDIAPTLLKNYLGVNNPTSDFSTGYDLLSKTPEREWVIASKFSGYAIITEETILEVGKGGYEMLNKANRPVNQPLNGKHTVEALEQISRFLK